MPTVLRQSGFRGEKKNLNRARRQRGFKKLKERGIHAASRSKFMET